MNWSEKCLLELTHRNMFDSSDHRLRFRDLLDCFHTAPFFSKDLAKCMYTATWDEYHFAEILVTLNEMTIADATDCFTLKEQLETDEARCDTDDSYVYRLCISFMNHTKFREPDYSTIDPEISHIIKQGLLVSSYVDELPEIIPEKARR